MKEFAAVDVDIDYQSMGDLKLPAAAFEMERLSEPATVVGGNDDHQLMFSRPSGEICMITVKEGYGDRSASLNVQITQDSSLYQGREVWQIFLNDRPFMSFATRDLAMQAFNDASQLLFQKFKVSEPSSSVDIFMDALSKEKPAQPLWKEVAKVCSVVVVTIFAICMAVRGAANLLQTPDEKRDSAIDVMRAKSRYSVIPTVPNVMELNTQAEGVLVPQQVVPNAAETAHKPIFIEH